MLFHQQDVHPPFENWYWSFKSCCGSWNFWLDENFFTSQKFFYLFRTFLLVENVFCQDNLIGLYVKIDLKSSEKAWKESKITNVIITNNNLNSWHSLSLHQCQVCCKIRKSLHRLLTSVNPSDAGSNCSLFQISMHHTCLSILDLFQAISEDYTGKEKAHNLRF